VIPKLYLNTVHELKSWPKHFSPIAWGGKRCEIRLDNGRGFRVDDLLWLREWHFDQGRYTGAGVLARITHVQRLDQVPAQPTLPEHWVALSIELVRPTPIGGAT
jgi:hypothetical protein